MRDSAKESLKYLIVLASLVLIAFGGFQILRSTMKTQYPIMVVVSQSMIPTLGVGDFILVGNIDDFNEVVAEPPPNGEILVFVRSSSRDEYIVHRAIEKFFSDGSWWFKTKGDHNKIPDGQPTPEDRVMGKVLRRAPLIGFFPLFIKTSKGFLFVVGLMALVFFAENLLPDKREEGSGGRFPILSLIPFFVAPLAYLTHFLFPNSKIGVEIEAIAAWYVGCMIAPLSFDDDDMGMMFWLYHFVLTIIPIGCNIVWWTTGITPSNWWYLEGGTVPITWMLQRETPMFHRTFNQFALITLPGCILFFIVMAAKRRNHKLIVSLSNWVRKKP